MGFDTVLRTGSRLALSGGLQSPESKPTGQVVHEALVSRPRNSFRNMPLRARLWQPEDEEAKRCSDDP